VTKPNHGSDIHGSDIQFLDTRAVKKGDEYIIKAIKSLLLTLILPTFIQFLREPILRRLPYQGISGFIVEREKEGVTALDLGDKIGLQTTSSCSIEFRDVKVAKRNLLGQENHGFTYIMEMLKEGRAEIANQAVGLARGVYDRAVFHAKNRKQFRQKIGNFRTYPT
jgi:alkylation response protein AidB-like acyl-CoA dehydrogenase